MEPISDHIPCIPRFLPGVVRAAFFSENITPGISGRPPWLPDVLKAIYFSWKMTPGISGSHWLLEVLKAVLSFFLENGPCLFWYRILVPGSCHAIKVQCHDVTISVSCLQVSCNVITLRVHVSEPCRGPLDSRGTYIRLISSWTLEIEML